tara:strand:- start:1312 stop:2031 length:720 start_codon:yes stop_codon:yes gene_type:complete
MKNNILVFIPTYNEKNNITKLVDKIFEINNFKCDVLVIDDGSPDDTYNIAKEKYKSFKNVVIKNRYKKKGIGSAHHEAILYAKEKGYEILLTMDSDFTHDPKDIPTFLKFKNEFDIVVGNRFVLKNSLEDWDFHRKFMTIGGHLLTKIFLGIPYDATGFFRLYKLDNISYNELNKIKSINYDFSFESLSIFHYSKYKIKEVPIILPKRTYGNSKMTLKHMINSIIKIFYLSVKLRLLKK